MNVSGAVGVIDRGGSDIDVISHVLHKGMGLIVHDRFCTVLSENFQERVQSFLFGVIKALATIFTTLGLPNV